MGDEDRLMGRQFLRSRPSGGDFIFVGCADYCIGSGPIIKVRGILQRGKGDLSMARTSEVIYILYLRVKEILKG